MVRNAAATNWPYRRPSPSPVRWTVPGWAGRPAFAESPSSSASDKDRRAWPGVDGAGSEEWTSLCSPVRTSGVQWAIQTSTQASRGCRRDSVGILSVASRGILDEAGREHLTSRRPIFSRVPPPVRWALRRTHCGRCLILPFSPG